MKALWTAISILAVAHLLSITGVVGYLAANDRLSRERLEAARDIFAMSITDQIDAEEDAAREAAIEQAESLRLASVDEVNTGVEQRLNSSMKHEDILREQLERYERNLRNMEVALMNRLADVESAEAALDENRKAFLDEIERQKELAADDQFKRTISNFKGMSTDSQKSLIMLWIEREGKEQLAVDILNALDNRTAQSLFSAFETPDEVALAGRLLERIKEGAIPDPDLQ